MEVFVKNRIQEIKGHKDVNFLYISTKENPADIASRGTSVNKLRSDQMWWHGPKWLQNDENSWKIVKLEDDNQHVNENVKSEVKFSGKTSENSLFCEKGNSKESEKLPYGIDIKRFSSCNKLIRVTAWIDRFVSKLRKLPSNCEKFLSSEELCKAEKKWKGVQ